MQQRDTNNADYKTLLDFVKDDYKLKTEYLVKHFERLWTRFTFLITFETALIGTFAGALEFEANYVIVASSFIGLVISLYWVAVSLDDNRLYRHYRDHHVKRAFEIAKSLLREMPTCETSRKFFEGYSYAGDTSSLAAKRRKLTTIMIMPIALSAFFSIVWATLLAASLFSPGSLELKPVSERASHNHPDVPASPLQDGSSR